MADLPAELIELILSFLPLSDRKRAKLVSKRWYELSNSHSLTKDDIIVIGKESRLVNPFPTMKLLNIRIEELSNLSVAEQFLNMYGHRVVSLEVNSLNLPSGKNFHNFLGCCPNLKFLKSNFDLIDRASIEYTFIKSPRISTKNLLSLEISGPFFRYLLEYLAADALELEALRISFDRYCRKFEKDLLAVIKRQSCILKELYLDYGFYHSASNVNRYYINKFVDCVGHQLQRLHIICDGEGNEFLPITQRLLNLKELELNFCRFNDDSNPDHHRYITLSNLTQLKLLSLQFVTISDSQLSYVLSQLTELQGLNISDCYFLSEEGWALDLDGRQNLKLLDLRINCCFSLTDDDLRSFLPHFPNLEIFIYYNNDENTISSAGLTAIADNCKWLRCLSLDGCENITCLKDINRLKYLVRLNLFECKGVSNVDIAQLKLNKLSFIVTSADDLTLENIESLIANCPSLRRIEMKSCSDKLKRYIELEQGRIYPYITFSSHYYCSASLGTIFDRIAVKLE